MVLAAGGAALQVLAQPGQPRIGVLAGELEVDVLVEQLEALLAADLRARRVREARQDGSRFVFVVIVHLPCAIVVEGIAGHPSAARSLRRAS